MEQFRKIGFVGDDTLEFSFSPSTIGIAGEIACRGGIVVRVDKWLDVAEEDDDPLVQTFSYCYNAFVRGYGNILRHDNVHTHIGHTDEHHRHSFDWETSEELSDSPQWCGEEGWPTLGEFIETVERWYWTNRLALPQPDGIPVLGTRA